MFCGTEICITVFTVSCHYRVHNVVPLPCSQCTSITVFKLYCHYRVHSVLSLPCSQCPSITVFKLYCHYRVHSVLPLPAVLLTMPAFNFQTSHFFKIRINTIFPSTDIFPKICLSFTFSGSTFVCIYFTPCVPHC